MKRRNRGKPKTSQSRDASPCRGSPAQSNHRRRWWPDVSLVELIENRVGSTEESALAAEHAIAKQLPGWLYDSCLSDIGDWPKQEDDQDGGD